jgi:hypothetical protein
MSGASWPATKACECGKLTRFPPAVHFERCRAHMPSSAMPSYVGRQVIDERARAWSPCSPQALRLWDVGGAGVREAGARTDYRAFTPARSSPPSVAMRPRAAAAPAAAAVWGREMLIWSARVARHHRLPCPPCGCSTYGQTHTLFVSTGRWVWRTRLSRSNGRQRVKVPAARSSSRGWSSTDSRALFAPARSSPAPIALRPRLAARSPISGAPLPATKADGCGCDRLVRLARGSTDCHKSGRATARPGELSGQYTVMASRGIARSRA